MRIHYEKTGQEREKVDMGNELYDIHNHILPGVDDGSDNMEMTLEMLEAEYKDGVRNILFTPHYFVRTKKEQNEKNAEKVRLAYEKVADYCQKNYKDMRLRLGNELYYSKQVVEELKEKRANTLGNTRYILTEFDTGIEFREMQKAMQDYLLSGYKPVLAHVERFACLYKNYEHMDELKNKGVKFQMNTENFLEGFFSSNKKYCINLVNEGYIDYISTDAHNMDSRKPTMRAAVEVLKKKVGKELLDKLLYENPEKFFVD